MLFGKRERRIRRILIVEDEPLVAFDNEYMLQDAGYEVVATVDSFAGAAEAIEREEIDLVLTDISLAGEGDGTDVARAAAREGRRRPVRHRQFAPRTARTSRWAASPSPIRERVLLGALEAIDGHLQGKEPKKVPEQLTLLRRALKPEPAPPGRGSGGCRFRACRG